MESPERTALLTRRTRGFHRRTATRHRLDRSLGTHGCAAHWLSGCPAWAAPMSRLMSAISRHPVVTLTSRALTLCQHGVVLIYVLFYVQSSAVGGGTELPTRLVGQAGPLTLTASMPDPSLPGPAPQHRALDDTCIFL